MQAKTFDYYCWDLYTEVGQDYADDEENRNAPESCIQSKKAATRWPNWPIMSRPATSNAYSNDGAARDPLRSAAARIGDPAPAFLAKSVRADEAARRDQFETGGKNAGCWVMPFESHAGTEEHEADKILVRSNGTVTYTGKDIAYQMWKLGLLGLDFNYKLFHNYDDGKEVWITTAERNVTRSVRRIRSRRNGLQRDRHAPIVSAGSRQKRRRGDSPEKGEAASVHLSYEMVALSPSRRRRIGF